jgi:CrcB protein
MDLIWIGVGGAGGAIARYLVDTSVSSRVGGAFPFGTLVVNVSGSLILGLLFAMVTERALLPSELRGPAMIGFVGAYTTFSTLMLETWRLVEDGAPALAAANAVGSVLLGLVAIVVGLTIGRYLA